MVFEKVCDIIAEQLGVAAGDLKMETSFDEDLHADSLDLFQIISELEEVYDIEFSTEETEKIKTVGDAVSYIKKEVE